MYRHLSFHIFIVFLMINVTVLSREIYDQIMEQNELSEPGDPGQGDPDIKKALANMGNMQIQKKVQKDFPELSKFNFYELDEFEIDRILRTIFSEVSPDYKKKVKEQIRKQRAYILNMKRMKIQHSQKLDEIYNFIKDSNYKATLFILYEIRRIIKTRVIRDRKRLMISQLEKEAYEDVKKGVMGCYKKFMSTVTFPVNPYAHNTNILSQHHVKDPYNDYLP